MTSVDDKIRLFEACKQREIKKLRLARSMAGAVRADMRRGRESASLLPAAACSVALSLACRSVALAPLLFYPLHLLINN